MTSRSISVLCGLTAAALGIAAASFFDLTPARAQDMKEDMGGGMMAGTLQRDPAYFRDHVQPLLLENCSGCHDAADPVNETNYKLVVPDEGAPDADQTEANYKMAVSMLHGTQPERSRLLQKIVPMSWGGLDHDGGKADGGDFPTDLIDAKQPLIAWVFGGNQASKPPIGITGPITRNVELGTEVRLDGTLSFDPEGKEVRVGWEVVEKPLGSKAALLAKSGPITTITPDRPGPYVVRMRVHDGKLAGWPLLLRFAGVRPTSGAGAAGDDIPQVDVSKISTAERRLTRALYLDLLGRTPVDEELAATVALPYEKRVDQMLSDPDAWKHWLAEENFYFLLIDRFRPVSDRVVALPDQLMNREISIQHAHMAVALSAEFNARNPGNDTYVTVVLEQFLGIEVQRNVKLLEAAKKMYDGKLSKIFKTRGENQSDIVQISLDQPEYLDLFVHRMEERYFGDVLPEEEHAKAVEHLRANPKDFRGLLRTWLVSDRYRAADRPPKSKNDHQFIRSLFVDLLGRPPGREEFRNMRNALQALADPAPLRGVLAKVILDSGAVIPPRALDPNAAGNADNARKTTDGTAEVNDIVTELFHRLLGRDPEPKEREAFTTVLKENGATWRTAALAILTSPHYQYY